MTSEVRKIWPLLVISQKVFKMCLININIGIQTVKFEGAWGKLEAKYCFQRQSWLKYMRQTLVLV